MATTLAPGARLGTYEIVAVLGEGGMGVVYRARDLRLKRDVAIKALKSNEPQDADAATRVLQEARRAASLNHPRICTVHEVQDDGDTTYIVMELVAGRTLTSMTPLDGLPPESVASYGAQIADALAHAHEHGVLHRDIKSANVVVSPGGQVKVLDFGLAIPTPSALGEATTTPLADAGPVGTLAYMAPEAIRGETTDERSDLWSFGIVLYEMAAGRRPFGGASVLETAAAILRDPLQPLPPQVPGALRSVVQRCLQRSPDERYQRASEVRAALEIVRDAFVHSQGAVPGLPGADGATRPRQAWWWAAAAAVVAAAVTWWAVSNVRQSGAQLSAQRAVALFGGSYRQSTLSPDGAFVAFVDVDAPVPQVWVKNLAGGDPIRITSGDAAAAHPTWSPANDQIVFARRRQGLWSVSPLGGPARQLVDFGENPRFAGNGERLVFEKSRKEIWTARADGSELQRVGGVPEPWYTFGFGPALSPDAVSIVYFQPELGPNGDLWVVPTGGGTPRRLTSDLTEASDPIWTPDGRFVVFSSLRGGSRTLWRVSADGGEPEPLTVGAGDDIEPALSGDGRTLLYTNFHNEWRLVSADVATWRERVLVTRRTELLWPRFSPDGSRVAFFGRGQFGDVQIYVVAADGQQVQQLTQGRGQINTMPRWAPDGSRIFFYQNRPTDTFRSMTMAGGSVSEVAKWPWETHTGAEFSPDGGRVTYAQGPGPGNPGLERATVIHTLASGEVRHLPQPLTTPRWSPDGLAVVGTSQTSPPSVTLCPAGGAPCRPLAAGRAAVWAPDGSRLYFLRDTASPMIKQLWSMTPDGQDLRMHKDSIGPFRSIDVTFDVSSTHQLVFSQIEQGRHELWQAQLR